jgi:GGDEF domain-containing protein
VTELEQVLRKEFSRAARYREPLAVLLIDLQPTGEIVGAIRDGIRLCDCVVPDGPTRVAVILPETPLAGAIQVGTRLGGVLAPPGGSDPSPVLAIGVGVFPSALATDAPALLRCAEAALDQARSRGGGLIVR